MNYKKTLYIAVSSFLFALILNNTSVVYAKGGKSKECGDANVTISDKNTVKYNADEGKIIESVCIKSGKDMFGDMHSGKLTNGIYENGCYEVSGVGTSSVTVKKLKDGKSCKDISHVDIYTGKAKNSSDTTDEGNENNNEEQNQDPVDDENSTKDESTNSSNEGNTNDNSSNGSSDNQQNQENNGNTNEQNNSGNSQQNQENNYDNEQSNSTNNQNTVQTGDNSNNTMSSTQNTSKTNRTGGIYTTENGRTADNNREYTKDQETLSDIKELPKTGPVHNVMFFLLGITSLTTGLILKKKIERPMPVYL